MIKESNGAFSYFAQVGCQNLLSTSIVLLQFLPEGYKMFKDNLIVNKKLEKGKRIGKGQFGEVFKGKNINYFLHVNISKTIIKRDK